MHRYIVPLTALALSITACQREPSRAHVPSDGAAVASTPAVAAYKLVATEAWDRSVAGAKPHAPDDALPDDAYRPLPSPVTYDVRVREAGNRIEVKGGGIACSGKRSSGGSARDGGAAYALDEGLFAGGRFVIRTEGGARTGELTLFGSGVPVVSSERGGLVDATTPSE